MRPEPRIESVAFPHLMLTYNNVKEIYQIFEKTLDTSKIFIDYKGSQVYDFKLHSLEFDAYIKYKDGSLKESNSDKIEWEPDLNKVLKEAKAKNRKIVYVRIECIQRIDKNLFLINKPAAVLELSKEKASLTLIDNNDELIDVISVYLNKLKEALAEYFSDKKRLVATYLIWNDVIATIIAIGSTIILFLALSGKELNFTFESIIEHFIILIIYAILILLNIFWIKKDTQVIFINKKWHKDID